MANYVNEQTEHTLSLLNELASKSIDLASRPLPDIDNKIRWLITWFAAQAAELCKNGAGLIRKQAELDGQVFRQD